MPTIYEEIADLMRSSIAGRDLARATLEQLKREAEALASRTVAMYYDPVDLAIARQKQRELK